MTILSICLLSILLPIAIVLFAFLMFILMKFHYLRKYTKYLDELEIFLSHEPYIEILTALRTVDITLREQEKTLIQQITSLSNDEIKINDIKIEEINENKENFASQFIKIEEKIKNMNQCKDDLISNLENGRVFQCKKIIVKCDNIKKDMQKIKKEVSEGTREFINPITDYDSKKFKYEKIVQKIEKAAEKWILKVESDAFQKNIDEKIQKIQSHLEMATNAVSINDQDKAFSEFTKFKKTLFDLILFGNHFDKFYEVLFKKANESYQKVLDYSEKTKINLNSNLENINVDIFMKNIEDELIEAKTHFYNLEIETTEKAIEKYFNSLLGLTFAITSELHAFNFFTQFSENDVNKHLAFIQNRVLEIDEKTEKILHIDKLFYWNLQKNYEEISKTLHEVNLIVLDFLNEIKDEKISYAAKQTKYKKIYQYFLNIFNQCDDVEKTIELFYTEGVSQGLKYNRLRKIYVKNISEIKEYGVVLSLEDKELISHIEEIKNNIEMKLIDQTNLNEKDLKILVDKLFNLMVQFIMQIIKKILIIRVFSIINIENAYKRIESNFYDKKIMSAEELLNEGQYDLALKNLIHIVKGESN